MIELDDSTPGKPYVFGGGSFGDELLQDANAINIFHADTSGQGYPQVTDEAVISANPQFIILTEDPKYGGDAASVYKRSNWGSIDALKLKQVYNVNGDIMSRPDPRSSRVCSVLHRLSIPTSSLARYRAIARVQGRDPFTAFPNVVAYVSEENMKVATPTTQPEPRYREKLHRVPTPLVLLSLSVLLLIVMLQPSDVPSVSL